MTACPPPLTNVILVALRQRRGWQAKQLAAAAGMSPSAVSAYQSGQRELSPEKLEALAAVMGYRREEVELVAFGLGGTLRGDEPQAAGELSAAELRRLNEGTVRLTLAIRGLLESELRARRARAARREGARLWKEVLQPQTPRIRRLLVDNSRVLQSWPVCERLALESESAAAHRIEPARELAQLALRVAKLAPGAPAARAKLQGFAWGYVSNVTRVSGDLPEADLAFARAWRFWREGGAAAPPLREWRLLDLEASLRRDQRRWDQAIELHDRTRAMAPRDELGRILLKRGFTLEQAGRPEEALAVLEQARPLIKEGSQPRLHFGVLFNMTTNLCHLHRYTEAEALLSEVRAQAIGLRNEVDLIRVLWVSARVAAGLGRREEARAALEQVRSGYSRREMSFDTALVSLELAVLLLEEGRAAEVQAECEALVSIFAAKGVHREALAASQLFYDAALEDAATVDLARRVARFLELARRDPSFRFEEFA